MVSYTYDSLNRITSGTGMDFGWDANGNLVYWDDGVDEWNYVYDALNRLKKVYKDSALSAQYTYDAEGRRVRSWDTGGTTDYVYSGLNVIDEVSGGVHEKHVYASGMHLASNCSGTMEYYHQDHLGSTRVKTNSTGGVVYESNYEPYGPGCGESGSEEYRYTGKREDPTGLYYFGARYYDPVTSRFTTRDVFPGFRSDPQSLNRYIYCNNNPLKYIDPTGHYGFSPIDPTSIIGTISFLGAMLESVVQTVQTFGGFITGILNPTPEPELSNNIISEITGGFYIDSNIEDLNDYLENSGLVQSSESYDETVDNIEEDIDMTQPGHRIHSKEKGYGSNYNAYQEGSRATLKKYLNNVDSDPTIEIKYDTKRESWNVFKRMKNRVDVIAFDAKKIYTWFDTPNTRYGLSNRWIQQNGMPFVPIPR